MSTSIVKKLDVFQQQCLRRILKITYRDRVSNKEVHRRDSDMSFVYQQVDSHEQPCFGHPDAGNGSKEGRRLHGGGLSSMTYYPSTLRGMKPRTLRLIEQAGERLPPNALNGTRRN